jgi:hypothetical protein
MPAIKITDQASAANALDGLKFQELLAPALISLYLSCVTATDTASYSVGSEDFLKNANPNIEVAANVVDVKRDQVLFQEPVPSGKQFLETVATTAINFLLVIEEV